MSNLSASSQVSTKSDDRLPHSWAQKSSGPNSSQNGPEALSVLTNDTNGAHQPQHNEASHQHAFVKARKLGNSLKPESIFILASVPASAAAFTDAESAHAQLRILSDTVGLFLHLQDLSAILRPSWLSNFLLSLCKWMPQIYFGRLTSSAGKPSKTIAVIWYLEPTSTFPVRPVCLQPIACHWAKGDYKFFV